MNNKKQYFYSIASQTQDFREKSQWRKIDADFSAERLDRYQIQRHRKEVLSISFCFVLSCFLVEQGAEFEYMIIRS